MTVFHHIGNFFRELLISIPMTVVRCLFAFFFIVLLIWVWQLPKERWMPKGVKKVDLGSNLRFWAILALVLQLLIYMIF